MADRVRIRHFSENESELKDATIRIDLPIVKEKITLFILDLADWKDFKYYGVFQNSARRFYWSREII